MQFKTTPLVRQVSELESVTHKMIMMENANHAKDNLHLILPGKYSTSRKIVRLC